MAEAGIVDGWFAEKEEPSLWPGQRFSLKTKGEVLLHERSEYQDIMVFDSTDYGRVLVLDGAIQVTERDEFAYQEMIVHLPVFAHPNPKRVLIVGGGDGGVAREVCRHAGVEKVVMCEIDQRVTEVAKKYFANSTATALINESKPKFELLFMDAALYMAEHKNEFDVIIVDSSDPVGPAATLYTSKFYTDMHAALREGGIVCTQGECQWSNLELISTVMGDAKAIYPTVDYAYTCIPTYPSGQIGFIIASKAGSNPAALRSPRPVPAGMKLKYYSTEIHRAAFVLPNFAAEKLAGVRAPQASSAPSSATPASAAPAASASASGNGLLLAALVAGVAAGLGLAQVLARRK